MADFATFGPAPDKGPNHDAKDLGAEFGHVVIEQEFSVKVTAKVASRDYRGVERINLIEHVRESIEDAVVNDWAYQEDDREAGDLVQDVQQVTVTIARDEVNPPAEQAVSGGSTCGSFNGTYACALMPHDGEHLAFAGVARPGFWRYLMWGTAQGSRSVVARIVK